MSKNILIAFDGTWNTPDDNKTDGDQQTNVRRFYDAVKQDLAQHAIYIYGVGTEGGWWNKFTGGAFGVGLSDTIQQGYKHLIEKYNDGDNIFIIGFSRGAYSARSLVGLIRNAGLLKKEHIDKTADAYFLYRTRDGSADAEHAKWFRQEYAKEITIHFLGVWDTVGALGIPLKSFEKFNHKYYEFHDTELSGIVKNAYHAIAIDEHRENYKVALWDPEIKPNQTIEQVWFTGAHSDVGGGYDNQLAQASLYWLMSKAKQCGLNFNQSIPSTVNISNEAVTDSYSQFLNGSYKMINGRYYRSIGNTIYGAEAIHQSVKDKLKNDTNYRPKNEVFNNLTGTFKPQNKLRI